MSEIVAYASCRATFNMQLEAAHVSIDDDRYHTMRLNVALLVLLAGSRERSKAQIGPIRWKVALCPDVNNFS